MSESISVKQMRKGCVSKYLEFPSWNFVVMCIIGCPSSALAMCAQCLKRVNTLLPNADD